MDLSGTNQVRGYDEESEITGSSRQFGQEKMDQMSIDRRDDHGPTEEKTLAQDSAQTTAPSLHQHRSSADGHRHTDLRDQKENAQADGQADPPSSTFVCQWDGDQDPLNPRSMSTAKKWVIVIIVSLSSMCV